MNNTPQRWISVILLAALSALAAAGNVLPVDLPPPDAKAPANDKPVKVYVLSGQSNMVGMDDVKPANPQYAKIFLTPDPSAKATALPMGGAALLKHGVYEATAAVYPGAAPPTGHLSEWLEEVRLPEVLTQSIGSTMKTK